MSDMRYFCIRGFMKSGTNWLGSLIDSHESISVTGEYHWQNFAEPFNQLLNGHVLFEKMNSTQFVRDEFVEFVKRVMRHNADPTAVLIGDRTPAALDPVIIKGAPFISIVRDGRDVLVSRAFHLFNNPTVTGLFQKSSAMQKDLERFQGNPWYFQKNPEMLLRHKILVRHSASLWREHLESDRVTLEEQHDLKVKMIRYEDLHADTEGVRKSLFEFLEVDPKRAAKLHGVLKPGFEEERPNAFFRKGKVGDWKNYFTDETKQLFKEVAGEELIRQGYESSLDW